MTRVAIMPVAGEGGAPSYCAVAGDKHSCGATAGEALDGLTAQLSDNEAGTLVIVQSQRPDFFFTAAQQQRLSTLMSEWRIARDLGVDLPTEKNAELQALIRAEVDATAARASEIAEELGR